MPSVCFTCKTAKKKAARLLRPLFIDLGVSCLGGNCLLRFAPAGK